MEASHLILHVCPAVEDSRSPVRHVGTTQVWDQTNCVGCPSLLARQADMLGRPDQDRAGEGAEACSTCSFCHLQVSTVLLCCAMLCCDVPLDVELCHAMPRCAVLCHAVPCYAFTLRMLTSKIRGPCNRASADALSPAETASHLSHPSELCKMYTLLSNSSTLALQPMLCNVGTCCALLCHAVLHCAALCCATPCCAVLPLRMAELQYWHSACCVSSARYTASSFHG